MKHVEHVDHNKMEGVGGWRITYLCVERSLGGIVGNHPE